MRRALLRKNASGGGFAFGNALQFDGTDDLVTFSGTTASSSFTLSYWFKWDGTQSGIPFGQTAGGTNYLGYMASVASSNIYCRLSGTNTFTFPDSNGDDLWHHVLITKDVSNNMKCYKDGVESTSGTLTSATANFTLNRLGQRDGSLIYKGLLDDVCYIEGVVGSSTDAVDIYNGGSGANAQSILGSATVYFHLDESGTDTTALDSSGNGNDGTLTNFPASGMWVAH